MSEQFKRLAGGVAKVVLCCKCRKPAYIFDQKRWNLPKQYCMDCAGKRKTGKRE